MWPGARRTTSRSTTMGPMGPSPSAPIPSCSTPAPRASCCTPKPATSCSRYAPAQSIRLYDPLERGSGQQHSRQHAAITPPALLTWGCARHLPTAIRSMCVLSRTLMLKAVPARRPCIRQRWRRSLGGASSRLPVRSAKTLLCCRTTRLPGTARPLPPRPLLPLFQVSTPVLWLQACRNLHAASSSSRLVARSCSRQSQAGAAVKPPVLLQHSLAPAEPATGLKSALSAPERSCAGAERNVRRTRSQSQAGGLRLRAMWNQMWRNSSGEGDDPTTTPVSEANYQVHLPSGSPPTSCCAGCPTVPYILCHGCCIETGDLHSRPLVLHVSSWCNSHRSVSIPRPDHVRPAFDQLSMLQADERQMVARQMSGTRPWAGNEAAQPSTASESTAVEMDIDPPAGAEEG